jgi:hypothetical protein
MLLLGKSCCWAVNSEARERLCRVVVWKVASWPPCVYVCVREEVVGGSG